MYCTVYCKAQVISEILQCLYAGTNKLFQGNSSHYILQAMYNYWKLMGHYDSMSNITLHYTIQLHGAFGISL